MKELDEVVRMISNHTGIDITKINQSDRIEEDLGCVGDDVYEFLEEYIDKFNIRCDNVNFIHYFLDEWRVTNYFSIVIVGNIIRRLRGLSPMPKHSVTVGDLVRIAQKKVWDM